MKFEKIQGYIQERFSLSCGDLEDKFIMEIIKEGFLEKYSLEEKKEIKQLIEEWEAEIGSISKARITDSGLTPLEFLINVLIG